MTTAPEEKKLEHFLHWLQLNGVELRGCKIKYCGQSKGFGMFSLKEVPDETPAVLLVLPLDLAITPMRVLQDPTLGPECTAMLKEGQVDDRFLIILFLTVERLRNNSSWKPYFDMLPTTFSNPLWFCDDELLQLKGTPLHRATELQKRNLQSLYDDKVKGLVKKLLVLGEDLKSDVTYEDFLWAHTIFWTRALSIPLPHSYVFPHNQEPRDQLQDDEKLGASANHNSKGDLIGGKNDTSQAIASPLYCSGHNVCDADNKVTGMGSSLIQEAVWVEGLAPGIDFCNHDLKAGATWEVDGPGLTTGVPNSMYILSALQCSMQSEREVFFNYGNKGNEELLYLYGFVVENNPDDYLMVHYPVEALQCLPLSDTKAQLLEAQKAELRCLLPRCLLDHGCFTADSPQIQISNKCKGNQACSYSWSGQRNTPSYLDNLVFPESFLAALRTIAMKEDEVYQAISLLEELFESGGERQPSDTEVRAAVWEACGDSGAFQLLVDLLQNKLMDLEEGTGTEDSDTELLEWARRNTSKGEDGTLAHEPMSRNRWCCIVYRRGQKQLTRSFLKEAQQVLELSLSGG